MVGYTNNVILIVYSSLGVLGAHQFYAQLQVDMLQSLHTGEVAQQRGKGCHQRLLALFRVSAQRLQVLVAEARKLIHVEVAVDGGEAALGAAKCQ